jgi:UDP-N-acetylmuramate dehydrogenase
MKIERDFSLKDYNTFGIEAYAKYFATFGSVEELSSLVEEHSGIKSLILGGGSNILFTGNYDGLVLKNEIKGLEVVKEDEENIYIKVGAGENWHQFVMYCVEKNYGGVENLSLIPGNVGASPMQNIGAYGVEIKEVFHELEALHLKDNNCVKFRLLNCEFGYRESVFKKKYKDQFAILNVTYRLSKKPKFNTSYHALQEELEKIKVSELSVKAISQAVINIRQSKLPDPAKIGNAGSFFKNPEIGKQEFEQLQQLYSAIPSYKINEEAHKIPAAWLIEQCGWKGYRKGDAGCHEKQPLVLVNYYHATGKEIYELSEAIKISVKEKFDIELTREVNII